MVTRRASRGVQIGLDRTDFISKRWVPLPIFDKNNECRGLHHAAVLFFVVTQVLTLPRIVFLSSIVFIYRWEKL